MTPLERALRDRIVSEGPITVEAYMDACNAYYYATRDPLGTSGDFTTAPEISQTFGELVGACLADCWARAGGPPGVRFVELGPGRGTLAADALRVMRSAGLEPPVHFVETSPVLREAQATAVPGANWHDSFSDVPGGPLLIVANEFFDALPVRQFAAGIERKVVAASGGLAFDRDGEIVEASPAREAVAAEIASRLAASGGVALIIDYGHTVSAPGDTLQAVRGHRYAPVLDKPGEQDLTAHVDFEAIGSAARDAGAAVTAIVNHGQWLERLGISARTEALASAHPERADEILEAQRRLCDPDRMGALFKAMAIHSPDWPAPAGFE
ncbi:MAG TPA: SAM-dependent methyltransferase [Sphingomicrobium sp.]|nr:SAM-dependent methyltransferase [Sphingomicrobium sp.]